MDSEIIGYIAGILTTICFVPQAWKIIKHDESEGVSLLMYIIFTLGVLSWLIYGVTIDNMPMMSFNSISLILSLLIVYKLVKLKHHAKSAKE